MESTSGRIPSTSNWICRRLEKVVLPDDEAPEINTILGFFSAIASAICAIFFSCRASASLISPKDLFCLQATLKSLTLLILSSLFQRLYSWKIENILSCGIASSRIVGLLRFGIRRSNPSLKGSRSNTLIYPELGRRTFV